MKTTIGQRIVEFVNRRNMTPLDFSIRLGYTSTSEFSRIKNGKEVSDVVIRKFLAAFPEVRREWLIDGKGDPEAVKDPWQEDRPRHLIELKADENGKRIPFYDTDVYATITPSLSDTPTMKPSAFISIPMFSQGEAAVQVTGHSMKGFINHGDWLIIKRITNRASLIYGEPHLIITRSDSIKTVKFIKQADQDDHLTLVPYNIEQFDPQDIRKDDVLEIWRVIGLFRTV